MTFETSIDINAAAETVWAAQVDVEGWPRWTPSVTSVERLDRGAFGLESQERIKQPNLPLLTWTVTAFDEGRSFTWEAHSLGVRTAGDHEVTVLGDGTARLTLRVRQTGPLAGVIGLVTGRQTRRFLALEAAGFKRCCERDGAVAA
jgi:uncharacterized membrane protein